MKYFAIALLVVAAGGTVIFFSNIDRGAVGDAGKSAEESRGAAPGSPILTYYAINDPYVGILLPESQVSFFNVYRASSLAGPWSLVVEKFPSADRVVKDRVLLGERGLVYYRLASVDSDGRESEYSAAANIVLEK